MRYRMMALLVLVASLYLVLAQCGVTPDEDVVRVTRDDFLRLSISDEMREATGLWRDQLHWRIMILDPGVASSEYWKGAPSEPGKKTIIVFLDHPNGVDKSRFLDTYPVLEQTAKSAVDRVIERHGWKDRYLSHSIYAARVTQ